jgi:integrase
MPRKYLMSWEGAPAFRWKKEFRKKIYRVTCRELGFSEKSWSKDETYQAANHWWLKKHAELVQATAWHPHQEAMDVLKSRADVAAQLGLHDEAERLQQQIRAIERLPADDPPILEDETAQRIETLNLFGIHVPPDLDPIVAEAVFGQDRIWADRKARIAKVPTSSTAQHHADAFLEFHRNQAKSKEKSTGRFGVLRNGIQNFLVWFGPSRALKEITEADVTGYYAHLIQRLAKGGDGNSGNTLWDHFQVFKQFIDHAAEESPEIPLPKNLRSKKFKIPKTRREPNPFTKEEFELILTNSNERLQAILMLMLNCGMYQGDVAELEADEVDLSAGRIVRARSKKQKIQAKKSKGSPIKLNWLLWDKTLELLKKTGNKSGLVFLNEDGNPLVRGEIGEDGNEDRQDNIHSAYCRVIRKLKKNKLLPSEWNKTLKQIRKTGANVLEKSKDHAEFYEMFLDHSAVAKRHYLTSGEPVPRFDEAVRFFGDQMDFPTTDRNVSADTVSRNQT